MKNEKRGMLRQKSTHYIYSLHPLSKVFDVQVTVHRDKLLQ